MLGETLKQFWPDPVICAFGGSPCDTPTWRAKFLAAQASGATPKPATIADAICTLENPHFEECDTDATFEDFALDDGAWIATDAFPEKLHRKYAVKRKQPPAGQAGEALGSNEHCQSAADAATAAKEKVAQLALGRPGQWQQGEAGVEEARRWGVDILAALHSLLDSPTARGHVGRYLKENQKGDGLAKQEMKAKMLANLNDARATAAAREAQEQEELRAEKSRQEEALRPPMKRQRQAKYTEDERKRRRQESAAK